MKAIDVLVLLESVMDMSLEGKEAAPVYSRYYLQFSGMNRLRYWNQARVCELQCGCKRVTVTRVHP